MGEGYPIQSWTGGTPSSPGWGCTPSSSGSGGTPHPDLGWGTHTWTWDGVPPCLDLGWGIPLPGSGMEYPPGRDGVPTILTWDGVLPYLDLGWDIPPPSAGWGNPLPGPAMGYPPPSQMDEVSSPLPRNVNRQTPVKTVPSLVLRTRAVKINLVIFCLCVYWSVFTSVIKSITGDKVDDKAPCSMTVWLTTSTILMIQRQQINIWMNSKVSRKSYSHIRWTLVNVLSRRGTEINPEM